MEKEKVKTESGYTIRIGGFVPVEKNDFERHEKVLAAINAARRGNVDSLMELLKVEDVNSQTVQRRPVKAEPAKPAGEATAGAEGEGKT